MNSHAASFRDKLQQEVCDKEEDFDIFPYITLSSLDIICGK